MSKQKVMLMALVLIVGMAGYVSADLIAYWPLDEGTGDIAHDIIGGYDGQITGGTWVTPGKVGDAAFEGSGGDEINCGPGPSPATQDLTIAWWMIDNHDSYGTIMDKSIAGSRYGYNILVRSASEDSPLRFRIGGWQDTYGGWGDECRLPQGAYNDGEWVHITCTYDSATDTATIYVNGELIENGIYNPKTGIAGPDGYCDGVNNLEAPLYIRGGEESFNGILDEVAIWDVALTPEQVRMVYESGVKLPGAADPDPFNGEANVPLDKVLSWGPAPDPNNWSLPHPAVDQYYVYMSKSEDDPNLLLAATVSADGPLEYDPSGEFELQRDVNYRWRVDSSINGSSPADPNTIIGQVWSFSTVPSVPIIDEQPADWFDFPGETAELRADSRNPFTLDDTGLAYQWYKDDEAIPGETDSTLIIPDVQVENEGFYKCIVTLVETGAVSETRQAKVMTKRLIGHWTMDGSPDDSSPSGNHAQLVGTATEGPVWSDDSVDGQALRVSSGGRPYMEIAPENAGDFNLTERFTASVWIKSAGSPNGFACLVGKHITTEDRPWMIRQNDTNNRITFKTHDSFDSFDNTGVFDNEWHLVTCTWDIDTGEKRVYIDGVLADMATGFTSPAQSSDTSPLRIGYYKDDFIFTNTLLDDVRIYNYALDEYAVAALWTAFNPGETICVKEEALDFNNDCTIDLQDFVLFAQEWMVCNKNPRATCP